MGARVCAQSLQQKKISRREASWLLAFINNIGPVYFSGYVLTLFPVRTPLTVWLGMYLLPFLYGIVLRYTLYRDLPTQSVRRLLSALHESILSAMNGIAQLGGYMVFFNLLNLFPTVFLAAYPAFIRTLSPLLEITNGLSMLLPSERLWAYIVLPFGGLCCIAQTASCLHKTGLSLKPYIFHKLILTLLTAAWYLVLPV